MTEGVGGTYVYGFMRAADLPASIGTGVGDPPAPVAHVVQGELAALVSPLDDGGVAPRRANLLAHGEVLRAALAGGPVLPLRFGIVMADEDAVRAEIARRAPELTELLTAFDGRAEMGVSALYREEVVLREVLVEHPEIARAREAIQGKPEAATHFERIRLGELVAHAVEEMRALDARDILSELEPLAVAVAPDAPLHERMVVNAGFLVEQERIEEFDAAVERVSRNRAQRMQFKLLGPLPPHSFVGAQ